ncbi:peptidoglycan-binding protein [Streptomyces sp. NPDC006365]|uniref:peptidoglycan-binding domain-containing protein n=1 Tax=unclassified Streptomyces TaxID=2593676 RepID=UPI00367426F4
MVTDDWGDEGPLSTTRNSHNSVVGLWQWVLWADGYLPESGVDCHFGSQTRAATMKWQDDRGLDDDGIVGPATFGRADNNLYWDEIEIRYNGKVRDLGSIYRTTSGMWYGSGVGRFAYTNADICG